VGKSNDSFPKHLDQGFDYVESRAQHQLNYKSWLAIAFVMDVSRLLERWTGSKKLRSDCRGVSLKNKNKSRGGKENCREGNENKRKSKCF
jgi:hypothetical protein